MGYNMGYQNDPYVANQFTSYSPAPLPSSASNRASKPLVQTKASSSQREETCTKDSKSSGRSSGSERKKAKKKMATIEERVGLKLSESSGATLFDFKDYLIDCALCQQGSRFI